MRKLSALLTAFVVFTVAGTAFADVEVRKDGSSWARIDDDGTIRINGSSIGSIDSDGTIRKSGSSIGRIDSDGTIRKNGSSWGSASSCCGDFGSKRTVVALLVFFSNYF